MHSQGRAGWIGFAVGLAYLLFTLRVIKVSKRVAAGIIGIGIGFLAPILFLMKAGSSEGRVLIYKVSANLFKDHWFWGTGWGNFKIHYNLYQAEYFKTHSIDDKEALLADTTLFAFNDVWQLLIEIGFFRFLILTSLAVIISLIFRNCFRIKQGRMIWFHASVAAVICVASASLFSYPLQVFFLQEIFLFYLLLALFSLKADERLSSAAVLFLAALRFIVITSMVYLSCGEYFRARLSHRAKQAFAWSQLGYKKRSLALYDSLFQAGSTDGIMMMDYAKQLYFTEDFEAAKKMIAQAKKHYSGHDVYAVSAEVEEALGNNKAAAEDYKTAMYMVPNRMRSRFNLFQFYLRNGDTSNALFWGNAIVNMPVKVPSGQTALMKSQTVKALNEIRPGL